jgi:hypothetical protein
MDGNAPPKKPIEESWSSRALSQLHAVAKIGSCRSLNLQELRLLDHNAEAQIRELAIWRRFAGPFFYLSENL